MVWTSMGWIAPDHSHGGHPSANLKDGVLRLGTLGPWGGGEHGYRKQGALAFIVPESGVYRLRATASSHPWGGTKADAYLAVMKKDAQRVGELRRFTLKADRSKVEIDLEIDAAEGHEILLPAEMPTYHSSTAVQIEDLSLTRQSPGNEP